jgi:hypothetical protein
MHLPQFVVRILRKQSNPTYQRSAWFTLALFVAYLVYVPIHLALDPHCVGDTVHVSGHHHHHHDGSAHAPGHANHDHGQDDEHHEHHPAELHDLDAVAKDDSLNLDLDPFLPGSALMLSELGYQPANHVRAAELIPERPLGRNLLPRPPPIA